MNEIKDILKAENDVDAIAFDLDDILYSEKDCVRSEYYQIADAFQVPKMEKAIYEISEKTESVEKLLFF